MKFFKDKKGFTLVELVVVIAILGILGGIAIPRFMDATASARGAKVIADMRTIDSAIMMYSAKTGTAAAEVALSTTEGATAGAPLVPDYLAAWPVPPSGAKIITDNTNASKTITGLVGTTYGITDGRATTGTANNTVDTLLAH